MNQDELNKIIEQHNLWLKTKGEQGKRAQLSNTNLSDTDLRRIDLSNTDLRYTNFSNADLRYTDLRNADLRYTDLRNADLDGANLDYSSFPLWCGSLDIHLDDRHTVQLLYHLVRNVLYSKNTSKEMKELLGATPIVDMANKFHRVDECGKINKDGEGK